MKTSELTGAALDWAVARCEGVPNIHIVKKPGKVCIYGEIAGIDFPYQPSTDWSQGGPINEREGIYLWRPYGFSGAWSAKLDDWQPERVLHDDKPLIAAMRCYVASKLGDTVDIPEELL